jgi:thioredoxin reductase (NADPH)
MPNPLVDTVIVGGGPAGLSAAVYLARARRDVLVIDGGAGRSSGPQINENYLGFPRGVKASRLRELGRRQAERFGARFVEGTVDRASCSEPGAFELTGDCGDWRARSVIVATGVTDIWPAIPQVDRYVGRSLFWCIVCDGFRAVGTRTLLIGADDEAATTALQFLTFTDQLTFVAAGVGDETTISAEKRALMEEHGIEVLDGAIERVEGARGMVRRAWVNGERREVELLFSLLGHVPNSRLAASLGVLLDEGGYVRIDKEQRTNVPCVYAAGDVSGPYAHQVTAAVHEGATAATTANWDLYPAHQKGEAEAEA